VAETEMLMSALCMAKHSNWTFV